MYLQLNWYLNQLAFSFIKFHLKLSLQGYAEQKTKEKLKKKREKKEKGKVKKKINP